MASLKLKIILASVISAVSIIAGAYWIGNAAYEDGIRQGITAVVEQCAKPSEQPWTFYNGETGDAMLCQGGHVGRPQETPETGHSEAPSPIPGQPEPQQHKRSFEDQPPPTNA
jgi:hypothetical protein